MLDGCLPLLRGTWSFAWPVEEGRLLSFAGRNRGKEHPPPRHIGEVDLYALDTHKHILNALVATCCPYLPFG